MKDIKAIVDAEIALVGNHDARCALYESYAQERAAIEEIERFFERFTSRPWSPVARNTFFRNWRSPGIGAASFCALTFRIMSLAEQSDSAEQRALLYRCATRVSEVSCEDVGIGTRDHQLLYEDFATRLAGTDEWKLDQFKIPLFKSAITTSRRYRQEGEDLGRAILISLPEELYNHGEFAYSAPLFSKWHREVLARPEDLWKEDLHFIHDHLGDTERGHFAALVQGFEDYCAATSIQADWAVMFRANVDLIRDMAANYRALFDQLLALDERSGLVQFA